MTASEHYARLRKFAGRALILFAAVTLFAIMWLTVVDVFFRDVFNISIIGLFEVTEILMGILVFAGLPIVTANDGHVSVTLLDSVIGPKLEIIQRVAVNILCTAVLVIFAWRLWDIAEKLAAYNDFTLFLKVPLAPVAYFMSVMTAISVPIQLALLRAPPSDRSMTRSDAI